MLLLLLLLLLFGGSGRGAPNSSTVVQEIRYESKMWCMAKASGTFGHSLVAQVVCWLSSILQQPMLVNKRACMSLFDSFYLLDWCNDMQLSCMSGKKKMTIAGKQKQICVQVRRLLHTKPMQQEVVFPPRKVSLRKCIVIFFYLVSNMQKKYSNWTHGIRKLNR
jgi:hypothetical protein